MSKRRAYGAHKNIQNGGKAAGAYKKGKIYQKREVHR